jgi:hypothetical protein
MAGEIAQVAADVAPFVTAYGAAVMRKTTDELADGTVGFGKKLARLLFRRTRDDEPLPDIVVEAVENPDDSPVQGALQYAIREALKSNARVLAEAREILAEASASGQRNRAGRDVHAPVIHSGRDTFYSENDQTIYRTGD